MNAYEQGVAFFNKNPKNDWYSSDNPYEAFSTERSEWSRGFREAWALYTSKLIENFLFDLKELCSLYKVSLSSGCGCCGAGGVIESENNGKFEFVFHI